MVCLFPTLEAAMAFDKEIESRRVLIENRPDIFGDQWILDENDEKIGEEKYLLSNATTVTLEESIPLVESFGGVCYPAHIDRDANGIIAVLGMLPPDLPFTAVELHNGEKESGLQIPQGCRVTVGSDAHYLWDIRDKDRFVELEDQPYSSQLVRERLIAWLGGKE